MAQASDLSMVPVLVTAGQEVYVTNINACSVLIIEDVDGNIDYIPKYVFSLNLLAPVKTNISSSASLQCLPLLHTIIS